MTAVRLERRGPVARVVLDRADRLNAFDGAMRDELLEALRRAVEDPAARVVVLTGAGRAFCAGADVAYLHELFEARDAERFAALVDAGREAALLLRRARQPVIAAVNGPAAGGGANLALACDLRIAADTASIGQTFSRIGLHPDWGGTFFLPRIAGASRALELVWSGRMVAADEALALGLFDRVVPAAELEAEVDRLAERLAAGPPQAIARMKASIYAGLEGSLEEALARELEAQLDLLGGADAAEGLRAFLEKRAPAFGAEAAGAAGAPART